MKSIDEILDMSRSTGDIINDLKDKRVSVPSWSSLRTDYLPEHHFILKDHEGRRDKLRKDGTREKASRIALGLEKLLVSRMSEFMFSIPVKRIYHNVEGIEVRKRIARAIENVYKYSRVNPANLRRGKDFFAACEIATVWYVVPERNTLYGFESEFKLKHKTLSVLNGEELYPLFDENGDLVSFSFEYQVMEPEETVTYFETYTASRCYKWRRKSATDWEPVGNPAGVSIGKIPCSYLWRDRAIYSDVSYIRKEIEYSLSRNSDVIAYNSAPVLKVIGQLHGEEKKGEDYRLFRMEKGGDVGYVSWAQSVAALEYHVGKMTELFWSLAQMPDISFSNMQRLGNIGYDARETLLTDSHLKVGDESGAWIEFFERECSVIKAFLKQMNLEWADEIDNVEVEHVITPFIQKNEKEEISKRMTANGGKPIESHRESIMRYGKTSNPDETLAQIQKEAADETAAQMQSVMGGGYV